MTEDSHVRSTAMLARGVLGLGAILVVVMGLFPPWRYDNKMPIRGHATETTRFAGYAFILRPPSLDDSSLEQAFGTEHTLDPAFISVEIETGRLFAQMAAVIVACALLGFALNRMK